jgi:hypothetical protein
MPLRFHASRFEIDGSDELLHQPYLCPDGLEFTTHMWTAFTKCYRESAKILYIDDLWGECQGCLNQYVYAPSLQRNSHRSRRHIPPIDNKVPFISAPGSAPFAKPTSSVKSSELLGMHDVVAHARQTCHPPGPHPMEVQLWQHLPRPLANPSGRPLLHFDVMTVDDSKLSTTATVNTMSAATNGYERRSRSSGECGFKTRCSEMAIEEEVSGFSDNSARTMVRHWSNVAKGMELGKEEEDEDYPMEKLLNTGLYDLLVSCFLNGVFR